MKEDLIERYAFGVMADGNTMPDIFSHSDQFLIMEMKNRKDILFEEYRNNPHTEICSTKYAMPTDLGDPVPEEEEQAYKDMVEIFKDCQCVVGNNLGYAPKVVIEEAGIFYVMLNGGKFARDYINGLIEDRAFAGFRD
ncbi:MAG: hypothetical protein B6I31_04850 [Desulfobacteraceae bacterium 4572_19]|nr:MAG: hypothetical protein B6I31_04850 [Desulfobacteraceae bacterium 4572_19]